MGCLRGEKLARLEEGREDSRTPVGEGEGRRAKQTEIAGECASAASTQRRRHTQRTHSASIPRT